MKKIELILIIIALIATYGNLYMLEGSAIALIVSMSLLATIYVFSAMNGFSDKLNSKPSFTDQKSEFTFKIGGFSMSIVAIGVLFYQLIWPGHKMMLVAGSVTCLFAFILATSTLKRIKKESKNIMLIRLFVWVVLGGVFLIIPQENWVSKKYSDYPSVIKSYEEFQKDPKNDSLRNVFQKSIQEIK